MSGTSNKLPKLEIGLSVLISIVIIFIYIRHTKATNTAASWVAHTQEVLFHSENLYFNISQAEYASETYLLTGQSHYLQTYEMSKRSVGIAFDTLRHITSDNPSQQLLIDTMFRIVSKRIPFSDSIVHHKIHPGFDRVLPLAEEDAANEYLKNIRQFANRVQTAENNLLQIRKETSKRAQDVQYYIPIIIVILLMGLLFILFLKGKQARQQQKKSEIMFRSLVESAPDAMIIANEKEEIILINKQTEKLFGYPRNELTGKPVQTLIPADFYTKHIGNCFKYVDDPNLRSICSGIELLVLRKDGTQFPVEISFSPLITEEGTLLSASVRDITQRKNTEETLKKVRKNFQLLVSSVKDYAIFLLDETGCVNSWNAGAEHIKGYTAEEIMGQRIDIFYTKEELEQGEPQRNLQMALQEGHFETEGWRVRKDGSTFYANIVFTSLIDEEGKLIGYAKVTKDITEKRKAEENMRFLAGIADNIQDPVISMDNNFLITRWNNAAEKLFEWKSEEVIGKNAAEMLCVIFPYENREQILKYLTSVGFWQGEVIYHTKSGKPINALITLSYLKDAHGNINGMLILVRDITARITAEDKLKEFGYFFNNSNDFSGIANTEGYFEIINSSFKKVLGYSKSELSEKPFLDFVHPDDVPATLNEYEKLKAGSLVIHFINRYRKQDGNYLWFDWNATPNPATGKLYCIARDITERKKAEAALSKLNEELEQRVKERTAEIEKNERRFRALLENNYDIISLIDEQFKVVYRSPSAVKITGRSDEEELNVDGTKNIHPDDREKGVIMLEELRATPGKTMNTLFRSLHKDGHYLWLEGTVVNLLQDEDIKAIVFNFRDVTSRIEAEVKLTSSEIRFRSLIENSAEGIAMTDEFSNNIYRSPGAQKMMGVVQKQNVVSLTHPDDLEKITNIHTETLKNPGKPVAFQGRFLHALGHYIWLEGTSTNLLLVEGVNAVVTNFRDITKRKELEDLLHNANVLARIGGWEIDLVKGIVYWSDITKEIYETENSFVPDLKPAINFYKEGEGRDLIEQKVREAIEFGKSWDVELQIVTAKNNERWIRTIGEAEFVNGKCLRIYGSFQDIDQRKKAEETNVEILKEKNTILESIGDAFFAVDKNWTVTYWNRIAEIDLKVLKKEIVGKNLWDIFPNRADSKSYRKYTEAIATDQVIHFEDYYQLLHKWYEISAYPSVNGLSVYFKDVTERKTAEKEIIKLNTELEEKVINRTAQLQSANKELESFSYSVSHDLRAPLRIIDGFGQILVEDYFEKLDEEGRETIGVIMKNARKMGQLIDDLLSFSKLGRAEIRMSKIDMNALVEEVIQELDAGGITIPERFARNKLCKANGDRNLLKQVWVNLISNAIKYSGARKAPVIEIGMMEKNDKPVYYVKDNGAGFNMRYSDKLFGVFQRLHKEEEFSGTGVGLALTQRIIVRHNGTIWAKARENKGATFYFTLPQYDKVL